MDSNSSRYQQQHHQQHQPNSGLLRFRSAPSSIQIGGASKSVREFEDKERNESTSSPSLSRMNSHQQGYVPSRFMRQGSIGSSEMDHQAQPKAFGSDLLLRKSSFPAAHFSSSNISFHNNGYDTTKGVPDCGGANGGDSELSLSTNRLNNQISFSSRSGHEFPYGSWNDASHSGSKDQNSNDKLFSDAQNYGEFGNQVHTPSHHLTFPEASSEIFAMENMIQFPGSGPCKIRAKRGFATHPRSIAERVRRTRISERIRKLQELVPNMDKQTSTADMLDMAVVYIKDLQKQFKNLSERRAKCRCMSMQK